MVLFHDTVDKSGNTIIYRIREAPTLTGKPFKFSVLDVIDLAKKYNFAIFAPHPYILGSTGGIKALGLTKEGRYRIAQIVQNRKIGLSIHNGSFDTVRNILKALKIKVPTFEKITSTPVELTKDADPAFFVGYKSLYPFPSFLFKTPIEPKKRLLLSTRLANPISPFCGFTGMISIFWIDIFKLPVTFLIYFE